MHQPFAMLLLTLAFGLITLVSAHEDGAPVEACQDFKTKHHIDHDENNPPHDPQPSSAPYKIVLSPTSIAPGLEAEVTIEGVGEKFKGFMIQGNDATGKIVGAFVKRSDFKTRDCAGGPPGNTATHSNPIEKPSIKLQWKAPADFTGKVVFRATVVKDYGTFWYNVKSSPLTVG